MRLPRFSLSKAACAPDWGGQRRNFPFKEGRYACVFYMFLFSNTVVFILHYLRSGSPFHLCRSIISTSMQPSSVTTRFRIPSSGKHVRRPTTRFQILRCQWLDSPECRYLTYGYLRLSALVKENEKKKARAAAKDCESKLRGRLVVAKLLPKDVGDLTVEHLKKATRGLRQREPDLIHLLRLNVNCKQLMNQLKDWVGNDNVC